MSLKIQLENNVWEFYPGETVRGNVLVEKKIWSKVEALTLRFYGKLQLGKSLEGEEVQGPGPSVPIEELAGIENYKTRAGEEVVLDYTLNLLESWKVLKPGTHEFGFAYTLPKARLPPSLKIKGVRVQYQFVLSLKGPRDDFKVYQTPFFLRVRPEEYSEGNFMEYWRPAQNSREYKVAQFLRCCWCLKGTVVIEGQLTQSIFPVGGGISFVVKVRNHLKGNLESLEAILVRKFKCKKHSRSTMKETVTIVSGPEVPPEESRIWNGSLQISSKTPPTSTQHNKFYEISYTLKFKVSSSTYSEGFVLKFPVILLPAAVFQYVLPVPSAPRYSSVGLEQGDSCPSSPPPPYGWSPQSPCFPGDQHGQASSTSQDDDLKKKSP